MEGAQQLSPFERQMETVVRNVCDAEFKKINQRQAELFDVFVKAFEEIKKELKETRNDLAAAIAAAKSGEDDFVHISDGGPKKSLMGQKMNPYDFKNDVSPAIREQEQFCAGLGVGATFWRGTAMEAARSNTEIMATL